MKENKIKLETLAQKSKKKKDFLIVGGIVSVLALVGFSVFNFSLKIDEEKKFIQKDLSKLENNDLNLSTENGIKETWAISIENDLKNQDKKTDRLVQYLKSVRKEDSQRLNDLVSGMQKRQEDLVFKMKKELAEQENRFKIKIEESLEKQRAELLLAQPEPNNILQKNNHDDNENIELGFDLLPSVKLDNDKKEKSIEDIINDTHVENSNNPFGGNQIGKTTIYSGKNVKDEPVALKKNKISFRKIDTSASINSIISEKKRELKAIKNREKKKNSYHIMTGLTEAFLITGVYAPVFSEGQSDPLPVLMQAQGDIKIANNDTESLADCFFIGSAKGNMNSQTADIRLQKISCSLADGKKKIEGTISGWVIGENGIPGVQGELLHKNGAWMAKTFVAGFLETFSQSAVGFASASGGGGITGTQTVGSSLVESGSQSTSEVFSKMGEYYLKMAEQIFPVIEVKPGRSVDILLQGGTSLTVTDFHSAEIDEIEREIEELTSQQLIDSNRAEELLESDSDISSRASSMDNSSEEESLPSTSKDKSFFE